ncbi:hypothetical protein AKH08_16450 [Vibrio parahaemolyticus]|nr:hypothetical protein AKH08_16450 [Vibrio parahaemolyticus]
MNTSVYFSINRTICVDKAQERHNPVFRKLALATLKKRAFTCELCHFVDTKLQQVVTRNQKYTDADFREDNLMVVCPHCYYGNRLGYAAVNNAIDIIYCPDIEQSALNHMTRTLMHFADKEPSAYLQSIQNDMSDSEKADRQDMMHFASTILCELDQSKLQAREVYQDFRPERLSQLVSFLFNLDDEQYAKRDKFFEPFRYILKPNVMRELNKTYSHTVFKNFTPENTLAASDQFLSSLNVKAKNSSLGA